MSLINILILILLGYLVITFVLFFFQRNLLYYPSINNYSGEKLNVSVEKVKIKTEDNIELLSWYHKKILVIIKLSYFCMAMPEL